MLEIEAVRMEFPADANIIVGQSHFIKAVEDLYEAVSTIVPHVSERYKKLLKQRDWRLEWAEKVGMGFELPVPSVGLRGLLIQFPKTG